MKRLISILAACALIAFTGICAGYRAHDAERQRVLRMAADTTDPATRAELLQIVADVDSGRAHFAPVARQAEQPGTP